MQIHSSRGARLAVPAAIALAGGLGYFTLAPAQAANNFQALANLVTCGTTTACVAGSNTSTGPGVQGNSAKGSGAVGQTTFSSTASSNGQAGVLGQDLSASGHFDVGVKGTSKLGTGVVGSSSTGDAIDAVTSTGFGLRAVSSGNNPAVGAFNSKAVAVLGQSVAGNGVNGFSASRDGVDGVSVSRFGVSGTSDSSSGVFGFSKSNIGVFGNGQNGVGVEGLGSGADPGVFGFNQVGGNGVEGSASNGDAVHANNTGSGIAMAAIANTGDAIFASTNSNVGDALFAFNAGGFGADIHGTSIGLVSRSDSFPLVATDSRGNNLFWVDGSGNVFLHGTVNNFARTAGGAIATEFVPSTTTPTVEDNGSALLVNGQATVKLDPAFAATIEVQHPYRVFLTPSGDTRGLYVAAKTVNGFVVREAQGGHSTLSFDYRILANGAGRANERMALSATLRNWPHAQAAAHHAGKTTAPPSQAVLLRAKTPN